MRVRVRVRVRVRGKILDKKKEGKGFLLPFPSLLCNTTLYYSADSAANLSSFLAIASASCSAVTLNSQS